MRRTPIKTGTQLIFPVLRIGDFFCVFLRYQIVINCVFSYFNWVITQIRSLIKVLSLRFKQTQKVFNYSLAYPQNCLLSSSSHRYSTEVVTVVYSKGNPICHVTGPLVFIGQSGMTQPNPNCHVTGPLVFIGQSSLTQSEVTFGLIAHDAGYPFSQF